MGRNICDVRPLPRLPSAPITTLMSSGQRSISDISRRPPRGRDRTSRRENIERTEKTGDPAKQDVKEGLSN